VSGKSSRGRDVESEKGSTLGVARPKKAEKDGRIVCDGTREKRPDAKKKGDRGVKGQV